MAEQQSSDGVFTFRTSSTSGSYNTHNSIPAQTINMVSVRVEMSSAGAATTAKVIYLDVPWLNSNHLIDGLASLYLLPIPLSGSAVTYSTMNIPIQLSSDIKETFNYRLVISDGTLVADLTDFALQFHFRQSAIS
jgi:hypothetical protein